VKGIMLEGLIADAGSTILSYLFIRSEYRNLDTLLVKGEKTMRILVIGNRDRFEKYSGLSECAKQEITYVPMGASEEEILRAGKEAESIIVDAMGRVSGNVIRQMPFLKLIHSEGVGFQGVDVEAAKRRGIYVCNCKGMNAKAVAEHTILLMLGVLRFLVTGDQAVRSGEQLVTKENHMVSGDLKELSECTIGLIGFRNIAKETARLAKAFGANPVYFKPSGEEKDQELANYRPLDELLAICDIVSLHLPVNSETKNRVNDEFFSKMKKGAILINTARGELVDSQALIRAIRSGQISGAGLDCIQGEPVQKENPILMAEKDILDKIIFSPHIAGVTAASFQRGYQILWSNLHRMERGEKPENIVWE
jgi:phosphoglycerate dehydrogenase-like enzyme